LAVQVAQLEVKVQDVKEILLLLEILGLMVVPPAQMAWRVLMDPLECLALTAQSVTSHRLQFLP
jgi:hypothetical protein